MDRLRQSIGTIQASLGGLSASQKMLMVMLAAVLGLTLLVVSQFAGRTEYVEFLSGASPEDRNAALVSLKAAGYPIQQDASGKVLVKPEDATVMMARLAEQGKLPSNTSDILDRIAAAPTWLSTRDDKRAAMARARAAELSRWIGAMQGIEKAQVFLDVPEAIGIGVPARTPRASVMVWPRGGDGVGLPQRTVDAIARLIGGAVTGLDATKVVVTDAVAGRDYKVRDESESGASDYREHVARTERDYREKLQKLVAHIPGAVVEVTADVDFTRVNSVREKALPLGEGTVSVVSKTIESNKNQQNITPGSDGATGANVATNVGANGGSGEKNEEVKNDTEFTVLPGKQVDRITDSRGMPTRLVASVNIPRDAIVAMIKVEKAPPPTGDAGAGGAAAPAADGAKEQPPTEQEITARFEREKTELASTIKPHLMGRTPEGGPVEGEVRVAMVSGGGMGVVGLASMNGGGGGGDGGMLSLVMGSGGGGGLIDKVLMGVLALVSLGMMLMMVRKAGKKLNIPTPEELVGLPPPKLDSGESVVGEADEGDAPLAGIELGEEQLRVEKMRQQVTELVKQKPDMAAKLINRWIAVEP